MIDDHQPDLFGGLPPQTDRYPTLPGSKTPGPSAEAAEAVKLGACRLRQSVLAELLNGGPASADQVAGRLGRSVLAIRPRISELKATGVLDDAGIRHRNETGLSATVWKATETALTARQSRGDA